MIEARAIPSLFLLLALVPACSGLGTNREPDAAWQERELAAPSDRVIWKLALLSVEQMDFPLAGGLDPSDGEITSGWKTNLQPFGHKGYRTRAVVNMQPTSPGRWHVKTRVQKQTNETVVAPLDAQRADWKWAPDDQVQAGILLHRISVLLSPDLELSEDKKGVDAFLEHVEEVKDDE